MQRSLIWGMCRTSHFAMLPARARLRRAQSVPENRRRAMRRLSYVAALALVVTLALASAAGAQGQTMTVSIEDFFFSPANMTVAPGTTVMWVNNGQAPHTSTADDGAWDSGTLQPGENFSFTFDQAGTYTYHCTIHPNMTRHHDSRRWRLGKPHSKPYGSFRHGHSCGRLTVAEHRWRGWLGSPVGRPCVA